MSKPDIVLDLAAELEKDLFTEDLRRRLAAQGRIIRRPGDPAERMRADVIVTGWGTTPFPPQRDSADQVRFIVHSAGTIRRLIPKSLIEGGLRVSHASAGLAQSVAELALFFTTSLLRQLHGVDRQMRENRDWQAGLSFGLGKAIAETRVGVIGAGRVGRIYIGLVKASGAQVQVYDPYLSSAEAARLGVTPVELDDLLRDCPAVAVHAPVTPETRNLLDARRLSLIQDGGVLVNTARSAVLDSAALERELLNGRLSAALDVFDVEPLPADSPLWGLPNVILTPHLGAITTHARHTQGTIVVEEIERFLRGDALEHEVLAATYDLLA